MNPRLSKSVRNEYIAKLALIGVFIFVFVLFILWKGVWRQVQDGFRFSPFDLVLLGLATLRLGRMVAYDLVAEPLRHPFARTVPDETGVGDSVEPRGEGIQRCLGQLISCPICAGTWIAALLVYALYAFPGPTRIFLAMTAAVGAAELLNALVEALCWSGELSRARTGRHRTALPPDPEREDEYPPLAYPAKQNDTLQSR